MFFSGPRFSGSDERRDRFAPSATILLRNGFFADPISGVGFNASDDPRFEYGVRATLALGRLAPDYARAAGTVHDGADIGGFANFNATERLQLQSALRYGSGPHHDGILFDAGASFDIIQWNHGSLSLDASASFANASSMRSYYEVAGGPRWRTLGLSLTTPLHPKILFYASFERFRLSGTAAQSPLVRRTGGSDVQLSVNYAF
jgi:outer membrane scaffolding protein for murein synthesis (MipA/OmpV family)